MKTIIKYELVINKALRSALNYDTPDEQINEFIRFFGKHIGSDRIYIFEDCDEKHITRNTYEWCADGIVPEIHELQNVDMDIIGWWYQAFDNEKNIIITDIEQIKDEHKVSYNLLKAQNVKNLVVCPIRYKDEIKGFFGVDNPPESDTLGLTTFLDMIGTLLISLLKLRNSFTKSNKEAKLSSYSSLSSIYISMALVNVQTRRYHIVKTLDEVTHFLGVKPQRKEALEFVDISTLEDRLRGKNTIVHEFIGKVSGWCRERFIPVDYDADGRLWHVLYCVENIDEEKRRENRLMYLAQIDLMTGIRNRGSGENKITEYLVRKQCGLLCLLDCDKFKSINDTYGHAVGDKVIIAIADTLRKSCRDDDDVVLRLGGDEFAVFIPGLIDKERAEAFFDRLFSNIEHIDIAEMNGKHILLSLGACFYDGMDCITFDQLYRRADTAMYDSKKKQGYSATIFDAKQ